MRIAQVAPLYDSVSPDAYGQTERVIAHLTHELVSLDHQVTLFASGDSVSQARLIAPCDQALRTDPNVRDPLVPHVMMMERLLQDAAEFDVVHFHMDYLHMPLVSRLQIQTLTTLHGTLDNPDLVPLYRTFSTLPFVSVSQAQRTPLPWLNWQDTVYYGLPEDLFRFHAEPGAYLAYLGPIAPEHCIEDAIEMAGRADMPLKIAASLGPVDQAYLQMELKPRLSNARIEFLGELDEYEKDDFLGQAAALLLPTELPSPLPLAVIEALACGTPVIASRRGVASEAIEHGVTGYLVDDIEAAVQAIERITALSRAACRKAFESRFTATRMAQDYLRVYDALLSRDPERLAA